jgi:hypothetical protein
MYRSQEKRTLQQESYNVISKKKKRKEQNTDKNI